MTKSQKIMFIFMTVWPVITAVCMTLFPTYSEAIEGGCFLVFWLVLTGFFYVELNKKD